LTERDADIYFLILYMYSGTKFKTYSGQNLSRNYMRRIVVRI